MKSVADGKDIFVSIIKKTKPMVLYAILIETILTKK